MNYARLGNNCFSHTSAYTTNQKYFNLSNPLYKTGYGISQFLYAQNADVIDDIPTLKLKNLEITTENDGTQSVANKCKSCGDMP
jgi:hypothetical protein